MEKRETYLTDEEQEVVGLLGKCFSLITKICKSEGEYQYDSFEACDSRFGLYHRRISW